MNSSTTSDFWSGYAALPPEIRTKAKKAFRLWKDSPRHPSLHFKKVGDYWSARIDRNWRVLGRMHNGTLYWFWIGPHDEYKRLIAG
ncbi:MAG: hypothetical protein O2960_21450 [Verrucomicrobia bacterium]|nr:hypothetical protein [Verrucomicrobiota bacterium]